MIPQIPVEMSFAVRRALKDIGRTEDVRFSPNNRVLAIAGFLTQTCLLLRVDVQASAAGPRLVIRDYLRIVSEGIRMVHGLDFINARTLAIANRDGLISILELPPGKMAARTCELTPRSRMETLPACAEDSPGSVVVSWDPFGRIGLWVCNNFRHSVSHHVVDARNRYTMKSSEVVLQRELNIPDGIALSQDRKWIAVSSHYTNDVKIYDRSLPQARDTEPAGRLCGAGFPHGLRFTSDDEHILVADAGDRVVRVYRRESGWQGDHPPVASLTVIEEEAFVRGHVNVEEGGPKGIDIDRTQSIVVTTCEEQPFACFPLSTFLKQKSKNAA